MSMKTQGTQLYAIDPADDSVLLVAAVTSIDGIDSTNSELDDTTLEDLDRKFKAGLAEPGTATFTINTDPSMAAHTRLYELKTAGTTLKWALGWSDGTGITPGVGKGVESVTVTAGGTGYTGTPTVTFAAPAAGGTTATGTVVTAGGVITGVIITNSGSGYVTAPSVTFAGAGTGAAGTSTLGDLKFVLPTTRSWLNFSGYLQAFPFSFGSNTLVNSSIGIRMSGAITLTPKA